MEQLEAGQVGYMVAGIKDIHGAPVGGRSGGGLVNQDGQLIGICNAADHEDNEGFYVSSRYITLMMQRLGIGDLIRNP